MAYISKLGFSLEDIEILILFEIIQVPTIGEITRSGFVDGWVKIGYFDTILLYHCVLRPKVL